MKPDKKHITIDRNKDLILKFLNDIIIEPRRKIHEWSKITEQTPILKMGYVAQHLASLILGMKGSKSGARGIDIVDGTEVKSCTRVDQVDKCLTPNCGARIFRSEQFCSNCGATAENLQRNNDSKWLFSIRDDGELNVLLNLSRILLILSDYPEFEKGNYEHIRYQAFEIYPNQNRGTKFQELANSYYYNNYLKKIKVGKKTSPMNFWPESFQFYMCNPIKIFCCVIENIDCDKHRKITITDYINPEEDRNNLKPEDMPIELISLKEIKKIMKDSNFETELKKI